MTPEQTASLFETGTLDGVLIRAKDVEETMGHFLMFNEMLKTFDQPLDQNMIKSYHKALKSGVFEDITKGYPVGAYKSRPNIVGNIITTPPEQVSDEMHKLLVWYGDQNIDLKTLASFHIRYEKIHPFQDGNGRTGRIILFKECLKNNIVAVIIEDSLKAEYYHALGNSDELTAFFRKEQEKYFSITYDFVNLPKEVKSH